ncbi:hypothetical protein FHS18_001279 [Paenibacillus phyllosphaerae]|uniref:Uncharacterized protein n=1 Tax=Paenibacillus phyllosphaerae TaxID=274593 RepID=A0A7W5FLP0_9BACL|nr:hypothetical protein [Paenibacillus phyllosphaerae]MBB3109227.1 hypothetical protein [Paenibacillus phyllosphaerae]
MEKEQYYVSVSARTIETSPSRSEQLEIEATEQELNELQARLEREEHDYNVTSGRALIPYKSAERDPATEAFSEHLLELYAYIYELGTPSTREHIESMDILPELKNQNMDLPGYK